MTAAKYLLSVPEFAKYQGITVNGIKSKIRRGTIQTEKIYAKTGYRKNHPEYRIHYTQLEEEAQKQFLGDRGLLPERKDDPEDGAEGYIKLTAKQRDRFEENKAVVRIFLDALEGLPAGRKVAFTRQFAQGHGISIAKLWRLARIYAQEGEAGLVPDWKCGDQKRTLSKDKETIEFIERTYMVELGPTIQETYERYIKEFGNKRDSLFSLRTVNNFINGHWTESERLLVREPDKWKREHSLYINRDWDQLPINACWITDSKQVDVFCQFNGRPKAPWLTAFLDGRSRKFVGWVVTISPDKWAITQAFDIAISLHGVPQTVYSDRGKPYKSYQISGGKLKSKVVKLFQDIDSEDFEGAFRMVGSELFFAYPKNAREKIIEPAFGIFTDRLRHLPGYRGHNIKTRPRKLEQEIKQGKLLSFEELSQEIDRIIEERNARPHSTTHKSPDSYYEGFVPVVPSEAVRVFLRMDRHQVKINNGGVKIRGDFYRGVDLWRLKGQEVLVTRDPNELRRCAVIQNNELLEICELEPKGHYRSEITLENREKVAKLNASIRRERKRLMGQHEASDPRKAAMEMGAEPILRKREIRPAASVTSINKRERLARQTLKELNKPEPEAEVREAATAGRPILQILLGSPKPEEPKKKLWRVIPDELLDIPDEWKEGN